MKKYLLYKGCSIYFLFSLDDFKRPFNPDIIYGKKYKIIAANVDYSREYILLSDDRVNRGEIVEFNSDEDAILWFKLAYGEDS